MRSVSEVKASARESLSGNWGTAILGNLIPLVILSFFGIISNILVIPRLASFMNYSNYYSFYEIYSSQSIFGVLTMLVNLGLGGVLAFGLASFFLNIVRRRTGEINDLFNGFKRYADCFLTYLVVGIFTVLWSLAFIIPVSIIFSIFAGIIAYSAYYGTSYGIIWGFVLIFLLLYIGIYVGLTLILARYAFVYYLIKDSEKTDVLNYIKQSKELMKGRAVKYLLLNLSFIGWALLCLLTCGLGFFVLIPYINTSYAVFYEDALMEGKESGKIQYVVLKEDNIYNENINNNYIVPENNDGQ